MPRKSLKIKKENDKKIQKIRSIFLGLEEPVDIDYTTMLNILIELGDFLISMDNKVIHIEDIINIMNKHITIEDNVLKSLLKNK